MVLENEVQRAVGPHGSADRRIHGVVEISIRIRIAIPGRIKSVYSCQGRDICCILVDIELRIVNFGPAQ